MAMSSDEEPRDGVIYLEGAPEAAPPPEYGTVWRVVRSVPVRPGSRAYVYMMQCSIDRQGRIYRGPTVLMMEVVMYRTGPSRRIMPGEIALPLPRGR